MEGITQYIITEENLQEVFEHGDWGMTNFQKFKDKLRPYNPQADNIDEWCKLHEEVLNDIRTEAYRSGYHDGETVGSQAEREKVLSKFGDLIHNESVRLSLEMVDMVYSYRIAQIIVELRKDGE